MNTVKCTRLKCKVLYSQSIKVQWLPDSIQAGDRAAKMPLGNFFQHEMDRAFTDFRILCTCINNTNYIPIINREARNYYRDALLSNTLFEGFKKIFLM